MAYISDLIKTGIKLGLVLFSLGHLPQATHWLMNEVANSQLQLVSLVKLNRALMKPAPMNHRKQRWQSLEIQAQTR